MLHNSGLLTGVVASSMNKGTDFETLFALWVDRPDREDGGTGTAYPSLNGGLVRSSDVPSGFGGYSANFANTGVKNGVALLNLAAGDATHTLGTDEFTIEFWVKCPGLSGTVYPIGNYYYSTLYRRWYFVFTTSDRTISFSCYTTDSKKVTATFTVGTATDWTNFWNDGWHHIAAQREGDNVIIYVDGVAGGATGSFSSGAGVNTNTTMSLFIGASAYTLSGIYTGKMDELRITKGKYRYTSAPFSPPGRFPRGAVADPDWSYVSLLMGFDNEFGYLVAGSSSPTITHGTTSSGNTVASVERGGILQGAQGKITIPGSSAMDVGSDDFTFEAVLWDATTINYARFGTEENYAPFWIGQGASSSKLCLKAQKTDGSDLMSYDYSLLKNGSWLNLALCRKGGNYEYYINGTRVASGAFSGDPASYSGKNMTFIMVPGYNGNRLKALRISKGARYSGPTCVHPDPHDFLTS